MPLFPELERLCEVALAVMRSDPQHQLLPIRRDTIYKTFGARDDPLANRARGWLAFITASRALPILEAAPELRDAPEDYQPRYLLGVAEKRLRGTPGIDGPAFQEALDSAHTISGSAAVIHSPPNFGYAARALYAALHQIAGHDPFSGLHCGDPDDNGPPKYALNPRRRICLDGQMTDDDLAIEDAASQMAKAAAFIERIWQKDGAPLARFDPAQRQAFWNWWLTEAISAAWEISLPHPED